MRKSYLIVVLAHSVHGRIRRIHVPHYAIHILLCVALFGSILGMGFLSSYTRMFWKVNEFNNLRSENEALHKQNDELKRAVEEQNVQLASLGELATEVAIAFGIRRSTATPANQLGPSQPTSSFTSFLNQYDFLQQVHVSPQGNTSLWSWLENTTPSLWPVKGAVSSSFGRRLDPFAGEGAFHTGVDLRALHGAPVVATADGVVFESGWFAQYGKRVVLSHGRNSLSTQYAHLSEMYVRPGQVVRRGEVIGRVGGTGKVTSPHLHYEVRYRGTPVNPYKYLNNGAPQRPALNLTD